MGARGTLVDGEAEAEAEKDVGIAPCLVDISDEQEGLAGPIGLASFRIIFPCTQISNNPQKKQESPKEAEFFHIVTVP